MNMSENKWSTGGVRHCSLLVSGKACYATLQYEAGVHRVQRVPATERGGRMHTSTVSVAVLPQPSDVSTSSAVHLVPVIVCHMHYVKQRNHIDKYSSSTGSLRTLFIKTN